MTAKAHATSYTFAILDFPGATGGGTFASGINDSGTIVGQYTDNVGPGWHSFIYKNGVYADYSVPAAGQNRTIVNGINDSGHIVGQYSNGNTWPIFINSNGTYRLLDTPANY